MKRKRQMGERKNNKMWNYGKCKYVHFTLYKERMTTTEAISQIARWLHVPTKRFSYAGIKDKQGKTSQRVSAFKIDPKDFERVKILNEHLSVHKKLIFLGDYNVDETNTQINLGALKGNNFKIAIRELSMLIDGKEETEQILIQKNIEILLNNIKEKGFLNYFGSQRFGSCQSKSYSHLIGLNEFIFKFVQFRCNDFKKRV